MSEADPEEGRIEGIGEKMAGQPAEKILIYPKVSGGRNRAVLVCRSPCPGQNPCPDPF